MRETEQQVKLYAVWCEDCENWVFEFTSVRSFAIAAQEEHMMDYVTYGHNAVVEEVEV